MKAAWVWGGEMTSNTSGPVSFKHPRDVVEPKRRAFAFRPCFRFVRIAPADGHKRATRRAAPSVIVEAAEISEPDRRD